MLALVSPPQGSPSMAPAVSKDGSRVVVNACMAAWSWSTRTSSTTWASSAGYALAVAGGLPDGVIGCLIIVRFDSVAEMRMQDAGATKGGGDASEP